MYKAAQRFHTVEKKLKAWPWFKKNGWLVSIHGFPTRAPKFVTFHVYKENWFNEDSRGIHIESFLAMDPKRTKKSYVTLHVLHHPKIPGTQLKRMVLAQPFVDAIYDEVSAWDGYKFRAGKYGQQPFTKVLDGSSPDFEVALEAEVSRLCQKLGPVMDRTLKKICQVR